MGQAILSLIFDDEKRVIMGKKCRQKIKEEFSLKTQARRYVVLFEELHNKDKRSVKAAFDDSTTDLWQIEEESVSEGLSIPLEFTVGRNTRDIFNHVLLSSLKELSLQLHEQLEESTADREERLKIIHLYQQQLEETQVKYMESLVDRDANLKTIRTCRNKIHELKQQMRAKAQEYEQQMRAKAQEYEQQMQAREAEQRETVRNLEKTIAYLSTPGKALRIVIKRIVYRSVFKGFFDRYYSFFDRVFLLILRLIHFLKRERPKPPVEPIPSINSPVVEAFVFARSMRGDMDDQALELFYQIGGDLRHVLCVSPSACNDQALYMISMAGAKVTYIAGDKPVSDQLVTHGITIVQDDLGTWMAKSGEKSLASYDGLVLDSAILKHDLVMLKGRLFENNKIFITDRWPNSNSTIALLGQAGCTEHGVTILDMPPSDWLDPARKDGSFYLQTDWPWKPRFVDLPLMLPSGRPWPKISVVTVTLNQEDYLEETLRSVLMQGYPNLEYIGQMSQKIKEDDEYRYFGLRVSKCYALKEIDMPNLKTIYFARR